jgi:Bacterial dnaA protein helix-turn-helix
MRHVIERSNGRGRDEWRIHLSPNNYADNLATYITDPSTIIAHTRREFGGRSPSRAEVEAMIARYRRPKREPECEIEWPAPKPKPVVVEEPKVVIEFKPKEVKPVDLFPVRLVKAVAEDFGLTYEDMIGPKRHKHFVHARAVVIIILRERNPSIWSFPKIGRLLGRSDHTSPINLWRQRDRLLRDHANIAASYEKRRRFQ